MNAVTVHYFSANYCAPCRALGMDNIINDFPDAILITYKADVNKPEFDAAWSHYFGETAMSIPAIAVVPFGSNEATTAQTGVGATDVRNAITEAQNYENTLDEVTITAAPIVNSVVDVFGDLKGLLNSQPKTNKTKPLTYVLVALIAAFVITGIVLLIKKYR